MPAQNRYSGTMAAMTGFPLLSRPANGNGASCADPDAALAQCLALLHGTDRAMGELDDDDPAGPGIMAYTDMLLAQAADLTPITVGGFACNAKIALVYGDTHAGERVAWRLLFEIVLLGRAGA